MDGFLSDNASHQAIEILIDTMALGWNQHDAGLYAAVFTADTEFTNTAGLTMKGRATIEDVHTEILSGLFKDSHMTTVETRIELLRPDVATIAWRWEMSGARNPNGRKRPKRQGFMSLIATADDGLWSIARIHNMELPSAKPTEAAMKG